MIILLSVRLSESNINCSFFRKVQHWWVMTADFGCINTLWCSIIPLLEILCSRKVFGAEIIFGVLILKLPRIKSQWQPHLLLLYVLVCLITIQHAGSAWNVGCLKNQNRMVIELVYSTGVQKITNNKLTSLDFVSLFISSWLLLMDRYKKWKTRTRARTCWKLRNTLSIFLIQIINLFCIFNEKFCKIVHEP